MEYGPAPEAAGPVPAWLDEHGSAASGCSSAESGCRAGREAFETLNPATGEAAGPADPGAPPADIDRAVRGRAARRSRTGGRSVGTPAPVTSTPSPGRFRSTAGFFAVLESLDNGKPIRESRDIDMPLVARHFYHHAGWAQLMEQELPGREPVGVIGQIIPWNFPLLMLAWKIAPALAMGNTVVLKPAEFTSLTALRFAELCEEIGLPPGW